MSEEINYRNFMPTASSPNFKVFSKEILQIPLKGICNASGYLLLLFTKTFDDSWA